MVRPGAVRSVRILNWLAGTPEATIIEAALGANESPTAYALALFGEALGSQERLSVLLRIAEQLENAAPTDAASLYAITGQAAVVSPLIDDVTRAQILLRTGQGLIALHYRELALRDWQQVTILARYAPLIPAQVRVRLLEDVAAQYESAGEPARAAAAREQASEVMRVPTTEIVPISLPQPGPAEWPADVADAVARRRTRARSVREALAAGRVPTWRSLEEALLAEEEAVQAWLAADTEDPLGRQERYRHWIQQRRLLSLGVLGIGAVPLIEARRAALDEIASRLWEQRELEVDTRLAQLPDAERIATRRAWTEYRLFVVLLAGDPHVDVAQVRHELDLLNGQLLDDGRLRLVYQTDERLGTRYWRLPVGYLQGTLDAMDVFR